MPVLRRLIAVATCNRPQFALRALAQRDTWVGLLVKRRDPNTDIRFFVGRGDRPLGPLEVRLDVEDSYERLPEKVQAIFRYAVDAGFDYVFKTDDDTFINPNVLLDDCEVFPHHYVGNVRPATGGYPAPYASGYAYWLSRAAMQVIVESPITLDPNEDRWVGNSLLKAGIHPMRDSFHYRIIYPDGIGNPTTIWSADSNIGHAAVFAQLPPTYMDRTFKSYNRLFKYYNQTHRKPRVKLVAV